MARQAKDQPAAGVEITSVSSPVLKIGDTGIEHTVIGTGFGPGMRFVVFLPPDPENPGDYEDSDIVIGQPLPDDIQTMAFPVTITVNKTPLGPRKVAMKEGDAVRDTLADGVKVIF